MEIYPFSEQNLSRALTNLYTPENVIKSKNQFNYLSQYFKYPEINAQTILIEDNYISKDFLHDYTSYYSLCFTPYLKVCKRIHFFSCKFSEAEFLTAIAENTVDNKKIWDNYIGFIVVKPIPVTIIGYTVLKTISNGHDYSHRTFWGIRKYKCHIYGNEVELMSLAFQEQDSVLSACATTAIWSMLNKASIDFHTILKSPSQITKDADNLSYDGSRMFPNKGLNLLQICQAIFNSGLVSEVKKPDIVTSNGKYQVISNEYLKKIINAYSSIGIPLILIIMVPNGEEYGLHAITVSGFNRKLLKDIVINRKNKTIWYSSSIETLYSHDDQWGPYAKVEFKEDNEGLITNWSLINSRNLPTYTTNIIVPLYPKIRISYEDIEAIVLGLNTLLSLFFDKKIVNEMVWDIKIHFSENLKSDIKNSNLDLSEKIIHLTKSLPKYLWVATCFIEENKVFEFTFDATDVKSGMIGEEIICYFDEIKPILKDFLKKNRPFCESLFPNSSPSLYFDFFLEQLEK